MRVKAIWITLAILAGLAAFCTALVSVPAWTALAVLGVGLVGAVYTDVLRNLGYWE